MLNQWPMHDVSFSQLDWEVISSPPSSLSMKTVSTIWTQGVSMLHVTFCQWVTEWLGWIRTGLELKYHWELWIQIGWCFLSGPVTSQCSSYDFGMLHVGQCVVLPMRIGIRYKRISLDLCVGNELWARQRTDVLNRLWLRMPCFSLYISVGSCPIFCLYEPHGYTHQVKARWNMGGLLTQEESIQYNMALLEKISWAIQTMKENSANDSHSSGC